MLSPPSKLRSFKGLALMILHSTILGGTEERVGTMPSVEINFGTNYPQVGSLSRVHSMFVADKEVGLTLQLLSAKMIDLILLASSGRLDPVRTSFLEATSKVNAVTSPTGCVYVKSQVRL